jgi:hypothetical protein
MSPYEAKLSVQDIRQTLEDAESCFRLSNFARAVALCEMVLQSPAFQQAKDKRKHDVIKCYIRYGYQANRCDASRKMHELS